MHTAYCSGLTGSTTKPSSAIAMLSSGRRLATLVFSTSVVSHFLFDDKLYIVWNYWYTGPFVAEKHTVVFLNYRFGENQSGYCGVEKWLNTFHSGLINIPGPTSKDFLGIGVKSIFVLCPQTFSITGLNIIMALRREIVNTDTSYLSHCKKLANLNRNMQKFCPNVIHKIFDIWSKLSSKLLKLRTSVVKFANKTAILKTYHFTTPCKSDEVTHPKQHKSFFRDNVTERSHCTTSLSHE